ncbi:MAG: hypothetical protein ABI972_12890 [Acidobacteriota bacterium]
MKVALLTTFRASRNDPLAESLERIHAAFLASGQAEPEVKFRFSDSPLGTSASIVDRAARRRPELARFVVTAPAVPNTADIRQISNFPGSPLAGESVPFPTLLAIAAGVPRSFPFHTISFDLHSAAFGEPLALNTPTGPATPGIKVGDSWWVSGRTRALMALTTVEGEVSAKKLPPLPPAVEAILAACGKAKNTVQMPLLRRIASEPSADALKTATAVREVMLAYRARLPEILDRAALPHQLPPGPEAAKDSIHLTSGPKKPALERAFRPLGYSCRGESGTFTLRRRTPANHTVEVELDVGTWSNSLTASFHIYGLGFTALLPLPVFKSSIGTGQYPIGDAARWERIVDNLAALTVEYEREFLPAVEAVAGPSPEWYTPDG